MELKLQLFGRTIVRHDSLATLEPVLGPEVFAEVVIRNLAEGVLNIDGKGSSLRNNVYQVPLAKSPSNTNSDVTDYVLIISATESVYDGY